MLGTESERNVSQTLRGSQDFNMLIEHGVIQSGVASSLEHCSCGKQILLRAEVQAPEL